MVPVPCALPRWFAAFDPDDDPMTFLLAAPSPFFTMVRAFGVGSPMTVSAGAFVGRRQ